MQIGERGINPEDYIASLDLRQAQIVLAALNMGKIEPAFETEEENIRRMQHNSEHPDNLIPEPNHRSGDMYSLFLAYISGCDRVDSVEDVFHEHDWRVQVQYIKKALIILGVDF